jgi:antitoxin ParD1/3/4
MERAGRRAAVFLFTLIADHVQSYRTPFKGGGVAMRSTQQFSVTLPNEMAQMVKTKVASGEYASESEVIRDGLRALQARDKAVENWLRRDVAPAYDAMKGSSVAGPIRRRRARLAGRRAPAGDESPLTIPLSLLCP